MAESSYSANVNQRVARQRLTNQCVTGARARSPAEAVARLGAVQAQDFLGALWAVGVRTAGATEQRVERAIMERAIVRTWPMRGTLHFVAAEDVRWMLELLTPRVIARNARRYRELELSDTVFARARKVCEHGLGGGAQLTRAALYGRLEEAGIACRGTRGLHILGYLAQQRVICFGPRAGKQPTFVLLDEWVPAPHRRTRAEALAELARRYFTSHGPATLHDFGWWSGLPLSDARDAIEMNGRDLADLVMQRPGNWTAPRSVSTGEAPHEAHLLPPFDEFAVAYRDRSAAIAERFASRTAAGGILKPIVLLNDRIIGTWSRSLAKNSVIVTVRPFGRLPRAHRASIRAAAGRYGAFLGLDVTLKVSV